MCFLVDLVRERKKKLSSISILTKFYISLIFFFNGQNLPKNVKKGIFVTKITNTFDFSSQKSKKKNWLCFSETFYMG